MFTILNDSSESYVKFKDFIKSNLEFFTFGFEKKIQNNHFVSIRDEISNMNFLTIYDFNLQIYQKINSTILTNLPKDYSPQIHDLNTEHNILSNQTIIYNMIQSIENVNTINCKPHVFLFSNRENKLADDQLKNKLLINGYISHDVNNLINFNISFNNIKNAISIFKKFIANSHIKNIIICMLDLHWSDLLVDLVKTININSIIHINNLQNNINYNGDNNINYDVFDKIIDHPINQTNDQLIIQTNDQMNDQLNSQLNDLINYLDELTKPSMSFIIVANDNLQNILKTINSICEIPYYKIEIIIVGLSDVINSLCLNLQNIKYVKLIQSDENIINNLTCAYNMGSLYAQNDYLIFINSENIYEPLWTKPIIKELVSNPTFIVSPITNNPHSHFGNYFTPQDKNKNKTKNKTKNNTNLIEFDIFDDLNNTNNDNANNAVNNDITNVTTNDVNNVGNDDETNVITNDVTDDSSNLIDPNFINYDSDSTYSLSLIDNEQDEIISNDLDDSTYKSVLEVVNKIRNENNEKIVSDKMDEIFGVSRNLFYKAGLLNVNNKNSEELLDDFLYRVKICDPTSVLKIVSNSFVYNKKNANLSDDILN
jgi:hypothetical protein